MRLPGNKIHTGWILLLFSTFLQNLYCQQNHAINIQNKVSHGIEVDTILHTRTELTPFSANVPISGLAISGDIKLFSDSGLVRIILMDDRYNEYLVYEAYPILSGSGSFSVVEAAEETSMLDNIIPIRVSFELIDASVHLKELVISEGGDFYAQTKSALNREHSLSKIRRINQNIQKTGQSWRAGETSVSQLSYQEKKSLFGGWVPNFQGFEYYLGGVYVLPGYPGPDTELKGAPSVQQMAESLSYPYEFSWQNRHGMNWVTPVKNQGPCGSCFAFGTTAAAEMLVNAYFNQILGYDLSEQQIVSCTAGSCAEGGSFKEALELIKNTGLVLESCFPYLALDLDCSGICTGPSEQIRIEDWHFILLEDNKKAEILHGATVGRMPSWNHVVQVVGFKVLETGDTLYKVGSNDSIIGITVEDGNPLVGETAWLIKNSWGTSWGNEGFGFVVGDSPEISHYSVHGRVHSMILNENDVICRDGDGDGYYTWGTGSKPSHCPECPDEPDGDDSDPCIGPLDENGTFIHFTPTPEGKDTFILYGNAPDLFVEGEAVRWYRDRKLQNLACSGQLFSTESREPGAYTYYVTQTIAGCESAANDITLNLVTGMAPPSGNDTTIEVGKPAILTVETEQGALYKWYENPSMNNLLHTGPSFATGKQVPGVYNFYVTRTLYQIESAPDTVTLRITEVVNIPDRAFLQALLSQGVDTNGDQLITPNEARAVTTLYLYKLGISDLTGIEAFENLTFLDCRNNKLTTLDVSKCAFLECLICTENLLRSLDVSACPRLTDLFCARNQLSRLDISGNLFLRRLDIEDMPALSEVCVWSSFTKGSMRYIGDYGSPGVCFQTDCNGDCSVTGMQVPGYSDITVYPNPTGDWLYIITGSLGYQWIEINTMDGKLFHSLIIEGNTGQIDFSAFPRGVYFITIRSKDFVTTKKVMKL